MATLGAVLRIRLLLTTFAAALALSTAPVATATASSLPGTPVPQGFVGVDLDGPTLDGSVDLTRQLDMMVANGVQTVRVAFNWAAAQPYADWPSVPLDQVGNFVDEGGVPTNFTATDQIVALAAQRGMTVLPTVLYSPHWDARSQNKLISAPARTGPYANFLTALVKRYGPHGTFWNTHGPKRPIRMWQIWNEPNLTIYWPRPFAKSYVKLLKAAHSAVKRADPGAKIVLGALTNTAWTALGQIDSVRGSERAFDVIAVNAFTSTPARVIFYLQLVRRAANRQGDHKPIIDTEMSWPSAKGKSSQHFTWNTTESGQARDIAAALPMLAANRSALQLIGFYYYTWMGREIRASAFSFAGLLRFESPDQFVAKPALSAFRHEALALEHCRKKGSRATNCVR